MQGCGKCCGSACFFTFFFCVVLRWSNSPCPLSFWEKKPDHPENPSNQLKDTTNSIHNAMPSLEIESEMPEVRGDCTTTNHTCNNAPWFTFIRIITVRNKKHPLMISKLASIWQPWNCTFLSQDEEQSKNIEDLKPEFMKVNLKKSKPQVASWFHMDWTRTLSGHYYKLKYYLLAANHKKAERQKKRILSF